MNGLQHLTKRAADAMTGGELSRLSHLAESNAVELGHSEAYTEHLHERMVELESSLLGPGGDGWVALDEQVNGKQFSREGLKAMHRLALLFYLKNPLIKRGVRIQSGYIFGMGVTVHSANEAANIVLQQFQDDVGNRRALTDPAKQIQRENELQIFGNLFFALFTNRATGAVKVRCHDCDEIEEVICNPDDKDDPWYYKRVYAAPILDKASGKTKTEQRTVYYPDWQYNPAKKPATIGGNPVMWDQPIYHVKGDVVGTMPIAPSELFAQLDWAKAYTKFLENRATVASALSRYVHKVTTATKGGIAKAKDKIASSLARPGGPSAATGAGINDAGATAFGSGGTNIEAFSVKGATINPEEGRRFLLMVCAGFGFPETWFGDASVGSLATAKSIDRPTEVAMVARRLLWNTVLSDLNGYTLVQAARAPLNPFSRVARVTYVGSTPIVEALTENGWEVVRPDVDFPSLLEHDVKARVDAVQVAAPHLAGIPKLVPRLMLTALGEDDIDETLAELPDEPAPTPNPEPVPPSGEPPLPPKGGAKTIVKGEE